MTTIVYDGSFEGWLTAVFEIYEYKLTAVVFVREETFSNDLFGAIHTVVTDGDKAKRVLTGLKHKVSSKGLSQLYKTFLSEEKQIEQCLLQYVRYVFSNKTTVEHNYSNEAVLKVVKTAKIVHREKHRMEAFIRFQLTKDRLYYAICQPDFNVLPLIIQHFKSRYADQRWLIYDSNRKYGIYYDLASVEYVHLEFSETAQSSLTSINDEHEELYQHLWRQYFESVNIKARRNMKLHIQHMPKRYWKYLTEKQFL